MISNLHYPTVLLSGLTTNPTISLEKQLSWAIETCCDRRKFDSSSDLKLKSNMLTDSMFLDWNLDCHLCKIKHNLISAYTKIKYENNTIDKNKRTKKLYLRKRFKSLSKTVFTENQLFYFGTKLKTQKQTLRD